MWTADTEVNIKAIFAAMTTTQEVVKIKPEKEIHACTGFEPMTSTILVQCSSYVG